MRLKDGRLILSGMMFCWCPDHGCYGVTSNRGQPLLQCSTIGCGFAAKPEWFAFDVVAHCDRKVFDDAGDDSRNETWVEND